MYNSYNSLRDIIQKDIDNQKSVLNKFPEHIARPITQSCSKYLAQFTSYQLPFKSDKQLASDYSSSKTNTNSQLNTNLNITNIINELNTENTSINTVNIDTNSTQNNTNADDQNQIETTNTNSENNEKVNIIQLDSIEQVNWTLENLMYGLTLSLEYQDTIKDCWNVYHDWLSVLLDEPRQFVPQAIRDDPINYSKKMLWHLYHLFTPRNKEQSTTSNKTNELTKHIMMCHSVLVLIETIAKDSKLLEQDLWEDVLKWLLAINDSVLSQPFNKEDFGEILSSRIVATLFEIWLIACNKNFPSPSLWKTFQEFCGNWRHHISLVIEWNRVCYALTQRLLELTWWPDSTGNKNITTTTSDTNAAYDILAIINSMTTETVLQAWFRFFHIIGKPLDFCDQSIIQKTLEQARQQRILKDYENSTYTNQTINNFSCVKKLPFIFLEFIKGISRIVDLFLGINSSGPQTAQSQLAVSHSYASPNAKVFQNPTNSVNLEQKTRSKSVMVHGSTTVIQQQTSIQTNSPLIANLTQLHQTDSGSRVQYYYKTNRSSVNSLLHLFGHWLFEAAIKYFPDKNNLNTNDLLNQTENYTKLQNNHQLNRDFVLGQAEAYGILCKIFCSVKTNEKILPEYLSRFYTVLLIGLRVPTNFGDMNSNSEYESGEILGSIIVNGHNMFKLDLDGVNILHQSMLNALTAVFKLKYPIKEENSKTEGQKPKELLKSIFHIGFSSISLVELKRYCIYIFSSLLCLANHLNSLPIYDNNLNVILNQNFFSQRSKILEIFLAAMSNEQDTINLQMLFGCGRLIVGEWSMDELSKNSPFNSDSNFSDNKKDRLPYCFNQIVSLICAPLKINNSTLQNHSFALAIFDSLSSIAAGDIINEDESVFKIAISWIWYYVKMQIKRRSREHTKEMHSVIVAAYNCLIMLLIKKPNLLRDKQCLQTVTNCIEIGISGSSSYPSDQKIREENKESNSTNSTSSVTVSTTLMKSEKELKPASLRVKEAAESVLCFIMEYTSNFNSQPDTVADSTRIQLNEKVLGEITKENLGKFKYFAIDGSLIVAVLDKSLLNTPSSNYPTVTVLLRGSFTCQAWSLHLRNSPFSQSLEAANIKINTHDSKLGTSARNSIGKIDMNVSVKSDDGYEISRHSVPKCELSIPSLSDVAGKCVRNLSKFQRLKEEQIEFETTAIDGASTENSKTYHQHIENCLSLKTCSKFQSARMYLSHLGFSSLESSTKINNKDELPEIIGIDCSDNSFIDQLTILDNLSTRTFASCSIFYLKKNQTNSKMIIDNINNNPTELDDNFYSFLHSIGTIIDMTAPQTAETNCIKKINKLNGIENVFYWSDISSELVFYLPNGKQAESELVIDETFKIKNQSVPNDIKVMIIWLEQMQDCDSVPVEELLQETNSYESLFSSASHQKQPKEIIIIFIHPLQSKMNRIITWSNVTKKYFYTMPLVDGMVVSSRMLSSMVRQTVLNIFRRKRLEIDDYQPPHVRRKNKISEIIKKFQSKKSEADFYTSLLMD